MVAFDLSAKIISSQQSAWVVHAGRAQRNFQDFINGKKIFLETPYLKLNPQIADSRNSMRQAIRRSIALFEHHNTYGSTPPSDKLEDYSAEPFDDYRYTRLAGGARRLVRDIQVGDVIMTPGRMQKGELTVPAIYFGEIIGEFEPDISFSGSRDLTKSVPFRSVNWLNSVPRKDISYELEKKIGKPPAIRKIDLSNDTEEILQNTYKSYIFDGKSSGQIEAPKYGPSDFRTLTKAQELIVLLVAAHQAFSQSSNPISVSDIEKFKEQYFELAPVENIVVDFASPGFWQIIGAPATLAAFVGLGIGALTSDASFDEIRADLTVENNVSEVQGDEEKMVEQNMRLFLKSFNNSQLQSMRDDAQKANKEIGFTSGVKQIGKQK
jgi:hypothetical protein